MPAVLDDDFSTAAVAERLLLETAALSECAVVAHRSARGHWGLVAFVVPRAGLAIDTAGMHRRLEAMLPAPDLPREYIIADRLPRDPTGAVDRRALAAELAGR